MTDRKWVILIVKGRISFLGKTCIYEIFLVLVKSLSCVRLIMTLWTVVHQIPLFVKFSRQGYGSGLPFHPPRDPPGSGIELASPAWAGLFFTD